MKVKGVDISYANGSVDFASLKSAGVQFVIIRCGYGSDYTSQDDERFFENVRKAEAAGMPWGTYLYSYAKYPAMAKSEAQHTLRLLNGLKPAYGVWYDVEDALIADADLVSICENYCDAIQAAGFYCGIYSSLSWLEGKLRSARLDKYDKWVAQWNSSCEYAGAYGIWQYSDNGSIGGKTFDMNYAYKDYPTITGASKNEETEEEDMPRYNTITEVPEYAKETIRKLCRTKGPNGNYLLTGKTGKKDDEGFPTGLDLSEDMLRIFVINDRAGLYE